MILWKELLARGMQDDGWEWDWTTLGSVKDGTKRIRAKVVARSRGVWAADGLAPALTALSTEQGGTISVKLRVHDGDLLKPGQIVCEWSGPARMVLALERPFLNLAAYTGGIATQTRHLVDAVKAEWTGKGRPPRVTSTRKTLPGYRDIAIQGVLAGGGYSHRVSLSGGVLIKENHIAAAGGIARAIEGAKRIAPHLLKIEVEVRDLKELAQALTAQADGVLLDNFTPALVSKAVALIKRAKVKPVVEVSGGITAENIGSYALEGVDVISSGSLTHSVKAIDLSLLVS